MGDANFVECKNSGDTILLRVDIELYESLAALHDKIGNSTKSVCLYDMVELLELFIKLEF